MPSYDYLCEANGRVLEISHPINENVDSWGELCRRAGVGLGDTHAATPVRRLISAAGVVRAENLGSGSAPACEPGPRCCGGGCDFL